MLPGAMANASPCGYLKRYGALKREKQGREKSPSRRGQQTCDRRQPSWVSAVRGSAAALDRLPEDLVLVRRSGGIGGSAALVKDGAAARRLLPDAVIDRTSIDEMMQLYGGGEKA